MHATAIIATFTMLDERFWGLAVWGSLMLLGSFAFLASPISPLPPRSKVWVQRALPILGLVWCYCLEFTDLRGWFIGEDYFYKTRYYQLELAYIISLAFGAGFSVGAIRNRDRISMVIGRFSGYLYLLVIGAFVWFRIKIIFF